MSHVQQHGLEASKAIGTGTSDFATSEWLDTVFSLLSNSRRRAVIEVMFEHERIDFGDLVDRVAELEYGLPIEEISGDERHTIYVSLQQTHCDSLEQEGIIERDRDTGTVGLGHNADELREFIGRIDGDDSLGSKLKRSLAVF